MADKVTTIRVPEEVLADFDELAASTGESRTDVMYRALIAGHKLMRDSYADLDHPLFGPMLRALVTSKRFAELVGDDPKEAADVARRLKNRDTHRRTRHAKPS